MVEMNEDEKHYIELAIKKMQEGLDDLKDFISAVKFNTDRVDIVLSSKCKTEYDVIRAVAHEVTHVLQGTSFHDDAFYEKWDEITDIFEKQYFLIS